MTGKRTWMGRRARGLTLIEMVIAIGILVLLAAFLIPNLTGLQRKSYDAKTKALIKKIEVALNLYHSEFLDYPPDGFDTGSRGDTGYSYQGGGVRLGEYSGAARIFKNTGCLVYFLCQPVAKITRIGASVGDNDPRNLRSSRVGPFLTEMTSEEFSFSPFKPVDLKLAANAQELAQVEILDAFGRPLEYDKVRTRAGHFNTTQFNKGTGGGMFGNANTNPHWQRTEALTAVETGDIQDYEGVYQITEAIATCYDPRLPLRDVNGFKFLDISGAPAPKASGHFDLWSHGQRWSDPNDDVGSWNIN